MRNFITGLIFLILLMLGIPAFASGPRILFIGDSHVSGIFGITLDSLLTQIPDAQIATYGSCGTIGASWMNHGKTTCGSFAHIHASGQPETRAKSPLHASTPQLVD